MASLDFEAVPAFIASAARLASSPTPAQLRQLAQRANGILVAEGSSYHITRMQVRAVLIAIFAEVAP